MPAWPKSFPLFQRPGVPTSGRICLLRNNMRHSLRGSLAGKPSRRHQILHKPILTVTKVQPSWPSRRHYRHRFLPRKPNLHNCSSHQRVPPFCWENSWHPCRHSPLSLRPKPPQCSFATLRNLRLHHPAESWHILSRHRCLGQGPEASVGTFCLRDISRWHGDW